MREIKFRGKILKTSEWVYGYYVYTHDRHRIIYEDYKGFYCEEEVDPETVGQYTGLKDRNGTGIYEGDIVKYKDYAKERISKVIQDLRLGTGHYIKSTGIGFYSINESTINMLEIEIIGNIYEHPHLLEGEKHDE